MRFVLLPFVFLSAFVSPIKALLLSPLGGTAANHRGIRIAHAVSATPSGSSSSSSTVLFYKNSTKTDYDIDNDVVTNPITIPQSITTTSTENLVVSSVETTKKNTNNDADDDDDDFASFDDNCFPGRDENDRFQCDPSVAFWRNFQALDGDVSHEENLFSAQHNLREMASIAQKFVGSAKGGPSSYFGRHLGRTAYFAMNAALGDAAFKYSNRNNENDDAPITMTARKGPLPMGMSSQHASRLLLETLLCYEEDYFKGIAKGFYREPWDMVSLNHRQSNPINALAQTSRFVREAVGTLGRRSRGTDQDKLVGFFNSKKSSTTTTTTTTTKEADGIKLYPDYYQTAFHYQGDGWMSTDSANVYETSTETLFLGRQDSMQRSSLPPLVALAKKFSGPKSTATRPMRVLEVACGTGRFLTFIRDNLPLDAECTALDLSPFYLEKASDNDAYWRKTRSREEHKHESTIAPATLVQAQAETLPFADNSFDAVLCVYLFHELPRHVRAKAAAEMARVVAPGGTVVLTDSIQKGDRPVLDGSLPNFQKMNEPFYVDYVNDDLGKHFETSGLTAKTKIVRSTTKSLSFSKPGELSL